MGAEPLTIMEGLAIGPPQGELVAGVLASARENGLAYRLLDVDEMKSLYPQHRLDGGDVAVREEDAGYLRPERSVAAAATRAEALGARLLIETEVESVSVSGAGGVIETSRGRFAAKRPLVAAGAWTPTLMARLGLPLYVERQAIARLAIY